MAQSVYLKCIRPYILDAVRDYFDFASFTEKTATALLKRDERGLPYPTPVFLFKDPALINTCTLLRRGGDK